MGFLAKLFGFGRKPAQFEPGLYVHTKELPVAFVTTWLRTEWDFREDGTVSFRSATKTLGVGQEEADASTTELPPLKETLADAMSQLPHARREALVLFYIEGKSIRDCAELLGVREEAFKMRLSRARAATRGILEHQL